MKALSALSLLALGIAAAGGWHGDWAPPDRWNPWAPLAFDEPDGWLTRHKLARLSADRAQCLAFLATTPLRFTPLPDRTPAAGCGFDNAVQVGRTSLRLSAPLPLSCRAAAALALWEQHTLAPAAERWFGEPVVRLDHLGSYACRNIGGRDGAARSQHASADAIDLSAFVLKSGRRVPVLGRWAAAGSADAGFLHEVRDGACRSFDVVLSPDHDAAHADHLHFDRGRGRACR